MRYNHSADFVRYFKDCSILSTALSTVPIVLMSYCRLYRTYRYQNWRRFQSLITNLEISGEIVIFCRFKKIILYYLYSCFFPPFSMLKSFICIFQRTWYALSSTALSNHSYIRYIRAYFRTDRKSFSVGVEMVRYRYLYRSIPKLKKLLVLVLKMTLHTYVPYTDNRHIEMSFLMFIIFSDRYGRHHTVQFVP